MHPVSRVNSRNQYAPFFWEGARWTQVAHLATPEMQGSPAWGATRSVSAVRYLLLLSLLTSCLLASACSSNPKASARIYEGDSPTIRYAPSHAGGPQSVY